MSGVMSGLVVQGYEFIEPIGEGGFASVWTVRSQQYNKLFVAKIAIVKNDDIDSAWKAFDSEIQALLRLDHPHVISLYAHFRHYDNFIMILEHCPNGSLSDYIRDRGALYGPMMTETVKDICSALKYCWSLGVQHRDIKPANIMFDARGRAKLVDFGISITNEEEQSGSVEVRDFKCSRAFAAPEILLKCPYDPTKSDMWAMGITILWMASGKSPWNCQSSAELTQMIRYGQFTVPGGMDPVVEKMARRMLAHDPNARIFPTMEELNGLEGQGDAVRSFGCRRAEITANQLLNNKTVHLSSVVVNRTIAGKRRGSIMAMKPNPMNAHIGLTQIKLIGARNTRFATHVHKPLTSLLPEVD